MRNANKKDNPLLARMSGEVLGVDAQRTDWFESCLLHISQHPNVAELLRPLAGSSEDDFWPTDSDSFAAQYRPYVVKDGVLHVPVMGVLLNRFPWQLGHWATGYTYIEKAVERGQADPLVKGIAFIGDTPGGEVSGCFELCDKLFAMRGNKPMRFFANERAYSAGYAIAACADKISMTRTGGVGSIGVVTMHVDWSKALDQDGIKITFIQAGRYKTEGNPYEPLTKHAKDRIQKRIDSIMAVFVEHVARGRDMTDEEIRDTEAECFGPDEAIDLRLADEVAPFEDALIAFTEDLSTSDGEFDMTDKSAPKTFTQAELDAAVASAKAEANAEGQKAGIAAERSRIKAITEHAEAKGKIDTAVALALNSDMNADAAAAVLKTLKPGEAPKAEAPKEKPEEKGKAPAGTAPFNVAMGTGNPEVGNEGDEPADEAAGSKAVSNRIIAAYHKAGGQKPKAKAAA